MNTKRVGIAAWLLLVLLIAALLVSAGCAGGGRMFDEAIAVDPYSVTLSPGQKQEFNSIGVESSPEKVSWKVQEGDKGGTIEIVSQENAGVDGRIVYTAPQTPGTYHVQVTGEYASGSTKTATATVKVEYADDLNRGKP